MMNALKVKMHNRLIGRDMADGYPFINLRVKKLSRNKPPVMKSIHYSPEALSVDCVC